MSRLLYIAKSKSLFYPLRFGLLYNRWAIMDYRNLANTGWHILKRADYIALITFIRGTEPGIYDTTYADNRLTYDLRKIGTDFWLEAMGTNYYNASIPGAGSRGGLISGGVFSGFKGTFKLMVPDLNYDGSAAAGFQILHQNNNFSFNANNGYGIQLEFSGGCTIGVVKDSTSLTNGQFGEYTGCDGKKYKSVCIGTKEYVFAIAERNYRNGDPISFHGAGSDFYTDTEWKNLTTEACCPPNGDWNNV